MISKIDMFDKIAIVTFENAPANISFVSEIFDLVAKASINVDMISQTAPKSAVNNISFTVPDNRVADVLQAVNKIGGIKPLISPGNVKISLFAEDMPTKIGVAADVFKKLNASSIDIMLITTSDVDISIIIQSVNGDAAMEILSQAYIHENNA